MDAEGNAEKPPVIRPSTAIDDRASFGRDDERLTDHAIDVESARRLAADHARRLGLTVLEPHVIRATHNLLVHLRPSAVLARVARLSDSRRDALAHMRNEVRVARFLADRGAPVVAPASVVHPGPYELGSVVVVSYWTYVEQLGSDDPTGAGRALARCHALTRDRDLQLDTPPGTPAAEALSIFTDLLERGVIERARGDRVAHSAELDLERVAALGLRQQVVHGDAHLENLLAGVRGPLWNDWEDTFVGPVEWDLACLVATAQVTGAGRARAESALRGYGLDRLESAVDVFIRLRAFQVGVWLLTMAARDPRMVERAEPWLAYAERRRRRVPRALADAWTRASGNLRPRRGLRS